MVGRDRPGQAREQQDPEARPGGPPRHTDAAKERREAERSGEAPAEAGPTRRLRVYLDVFPLVDDD